jgi:hypothetical protein
MEHFENRQQGSAVDTAFDAEPGGREFDQNRAVGGNVSLGTVVGLRAMRTGSSDDSAVAGDRRPLRNCLLQRKTWFVFTSLARAMTETEAPGTKLASTMRILCASGSVRRVFETNAFSIQFRFR